MPVRPSRVRRLRTRKAMGNAALVGAIVATGLAYVAVQKTVTLVVDQERPEAVRTMSGNVGELLDAEGIVLESGDLVVPSEATPLADGMTVLVTRDWVTAGVEPDPHSVGVWVMEGASAPHLLLAGRDAGDWFSAGNPVERSQVVPASVVVKGKDHDVLTNAGTVRELLSAMGISPDRDDRVLPSPRTPIHAGIGVRFVQIEYRTTGVRVPIPHTTLTRTSDHLDPGEVQWVRDGIDGLLVEQIRVRYVNGEARGRRVLSRQVIRPAVPARRIVGAADHASGTQVGEASWYSFAPGDGLTAAHPWLPFGTVVAVTNLGNGRTVQVVINDRGPFGGRIIDLSSEAFARIAPLGQGVCQVRLTW
jgi:rare lipoprotein A